MEIRLDRIGRKATIGTRGDIRLSGEGVLARHAELRVEEHAGEMRVVLGSTGGDVWVERGRTQTLLRFPSETVLLDGDAFRICRHQFSYSDLGAASLDDDTEGDVRRLVQWLTP